jgi:RNA polymerase sigma factor (sigma-70 family)
MKLLAMHIMHDEFEADEIVGESFAALAKKLLETPGVFPSTAYAKAYLVSILRNKCCSWLRKKRPITVGEREEMIIDEHFLLQELEKRDMMLQLQTLIDDLPPLLNRVAVLFFKNGLSCEEAARELNLEKQVVLVYKSRAFKKLKEMAIARNYTERIDQKTPARVVNLNDGKLGSKAVGDSF